MYQIQIMYRRVGLIETRNHWLCYLEVTSRELKLAYQVPIKHVHRDVWLTQCPDAANGDSHITFNSETLAGAVNDLCKRVRHKRDARRIRALLVTNIMERGRTS